MNPWRECGQPACAMCAELRAERGAPIEESGVWRGAHSAAASVRMLDELERIEGSAKAAAIEAGVSPSHWSHLRRRAEHGLGMYAATRARIGAAIERGRARKAIEVAGRKGSKS